MDSYGQTTTKINQSWSNYDKMVAICQMANYGKVFLDEYGCPIDNEYEIEVLAGQERE